MKDATLLILAAGIGRRFGGPKQLTPVDEHGNLLIDYSIFDARRAGFSRVLFLINREIDEAFRAAIGERIAAHMEVDYAYQELTALPAGFHVPVGRTRPLGTGHALICCKEHIDGPFAVINADDYYGRDAYTSILHYLRTPQAANDYALLGYRLGDTLSKTGGVTRGVCVTAKDGSLLRIDETQHIVSAPDGGGVVQMGEETIFLPKETPVSMNFWGFTPHVFAQLEEGFEAFLRGALNENPADSEFILPTAICDLLEADRARVQLLPAAGKWIGMTYQDDMPHVRRAIRALVEAGEYPPVLWE